LPVLHLLAEGERGAVHAPHFGLRDPGGLHGAPELPDEDALDRDGGGFLEPAFFAQEVLEIAADAGMGFAFFHFRRSRQ
jgi:hypothetical protein